MVGGPGGLLGIVQAGRSARVASVVVAFIDADDSGCGGWGNERDDLGRLRIGLDGDKDGLWQVAEVMRFSGRSGRAWARPDTRCGRSTSTDGRSDRHG